MSSSEAESEKMSSKWLLAFCGEGGDGDGGEEARCICAGETEMDSMAKVREAGGLSRSMSSYALELFSGSTDSFTGVWLC